MGKVKKFQNPQQKKSDLQWANQNSRTIRKENNLSKTTGATSKLKKQQTGLPNLAKHKQSLLQSVNRKTNMDLHLKHKIHANLATKKHKDLNDLVNAAQKQRT